MGDLMPPEAYIQALNALRNIRDQRRELKAQLRDLRHSENAILNNFRAPQQTAEPPQHQE